MIGTPGANTGGFDGGQSAAPSQMAGHGSSAGAPASAAPVAHSGAVSMPPVDLVGALLSDRYRVLKKLGEGGMGSVYLCEHTTINKKLAIKVLSSEYSHKQDLVDRFLQEARAASMIEQENVVEITDFGSTPNGSVFFVMEFLNGEDLSRTIKSNGSLPWARVKPIMLQICAALTAAHDVGIVHRDMKPENCYRIRRGDRHDFIKVLDFGIAKVTSEEGDGSKGLTRTGMIFGTPEYMSPEQAKGEKVDHRVDVYAVGIILYEMLTGRVPFTADTFMGILTKHMFEAPPAPSIVAPQADIPPQVEAIILKALQKDREYRFQSMPELAAAIKAVGTDSAAVSVVAENVAVPGRGETRYQTSNTGVPLVADRALPRARERRGAGVLIGIGAFVLAIGGAAAYLVLNGDAGPNDGSKAAAAAGSKAEPGKKGAVPKPDRPPPVDDGEAIDEPPPEDPTAADGEVPVDPVPTVAMITVSTPDIDGEVIDARDETVLGKTNEAFELPIDAESLELMVRAEGYEELVVAVVPDADKTLPAELTKVRRGKNGRRNGRNGRTGRNGGTQASGDTTKPAGGTTKPSGGTTKPSGGTTKPSGDGGGSSPDLKDPFKNH